VANPSRRAFPRVPAPPAFVRCRRAGPLGPGRPRRPRRRRPAAASPSPPTPSRRNLNPAIVASNGVLTSQQGDSSRFAEMADGGRASGRCWQPVGKARPTSRPSPSSCGRSVECTMASRSPRRTVASGDSEVWKKLQNLGQALYRNLEAVDTPDATTAIFRFAKPTPLQLIENALPARPGVAAEASLCRHRHRQEPRTTRTRSAPASAMPSTSRRILPATRNPTYWDKGKPYLDEIVLRVLPDPGAITAALEPGNPARRVLRGAAQRPRPDRRRSRPDRRHPRL